MKAQVSKSNDIYGLMVQSWADKNHIKLTCNKSSGADLVLIDFSDFKYLGEVLEAAQGAIVHSQGNAVVGILYNNDSVVPHLTNESKKIGCHFIMKKTSNIDEMLDELKKDLDKFVSGVQSFKSYR